MSTTHTTPCTLLTVVRIFSVTFTFLLLQIPPVHAATGMLNITHTLSLGSRGADVFMLQRYLTGTGDYTYGEITGYFGPITQAAVQRWQARNGIVSHGSPRTTGWGTVGPRTRALMKQLVMTDGPSTVPSGDTAIPNIPTPPGNTPVVSDPVPTAPPKTVEDPALPITVSFAQPLIDSIVKSTAKLEVAFSGTISDVTFKDGNTVLATITAAPYAYNWDTTGATNGPHTLTAIARGKAGDTKSVTTWVTVWNTEAVSQNSSSVSISPVTILDYTTSILDAQSPTIIRGSERFTFVSSGGPTTQWTKYSGTLNNPLTSIVWKKPAYQVLGRPAPASTAEVYDYPWLMNTYQEPGGGVLGFLHVERKTYTEPGYSNPKGRIALIWSDDYGDTWKYLGDIIIPDKDPVVNPAGVPYVIKDGYFYIYFQELNYSADGTSIAGIEVARAKVADVIAAAKQGKNVPWYKYYDGEWKSPGLGGHATPIIYRAPEGHIHTDAAYSTYTGKYYLLLANALSQIKLYESDDAIHWMFLKYVATRAKVAGQAGYVYQSIVNSDGTDNGIVGKSFYIYGTILDPSINTGSGFPIMRWIINLDPPFSNTPPPYVFVNGFSSTQGKNQWSYKFASSSTYTAMTWDDTNKRWQGKEKNSLIGKGWLHPGNESDAALMWVAPNTGTVTITGTVSDGDSKCGDGIVARIVHDSSVLWQQTLDNADRQGKNHSLTEQVSAGSSLYFVVNKRNTISCDATSWNPTVTYSNVVAS